MPNHVHIIIVPHHEDGLRATFGEAHRRYTRHINARHKWTGHLWQGRFGAAGKRKGLFQQGASFLHIEFWAGLLAAIVV